MKPIQQDDIQDWLKQPIKNKKRRECICEIPKWSIKPNGKTRHCYCTSCSGIIKKIK